MFKEVLILFFLIAAIGAATAFIFNYKEEATADFFPKPVEDVNAAATAPKVMQFHRR